VVNGELARPEQLSPEAEFSDRKPCRWRSRDVHDQSRKTVGCTIVLKISD